MIALTLTASLTGQPAEPLASRDVVQPSLIERFLRRAETPLRSYRAARRLEARNKRFGVEGWMEVETELSAPDQFSWRVISEGGSGYIRNRVLRKALDTEVEAARAGQPGKAALTDENYTFSALQAPMEQRGDAAEHSAQVRIRVMPRRQDVMLVDGTVLLTKDDGDLIAIEGRLSKNPSFWTRSVNVIRRYERLAGIRVPVEMQSTANVRIAGESHFRMTYRYHEINGTTVMSALGEWVIE